MKKQNKTVRKHLLFRPVFTFFFGYGRIDLMKKTAKKKNAGERPAVKKEKKDNIGPK